MEAKLLAVLKKVTDYHHGRGDYYFAYLPEAEWANEAFDAWHAIIAEIDCLIAEAKRKDEQSE